MTKENSAFANPGFMSSKVDLITINSAESDENIDVSIYFLNPLFNSLKSV